MQALAPEKYVPLASARKAKGRDYSLKAAKRL
jgi:hypothetical protein